MGIFNTQNPEKAAAPGFKATRPIVPRKKILGKIKLVDGQILSGNCYFRTTVSNIRDGLNQTEEAFVPLTDAADERGNPLPGTLILNFVHIVFLAFPAAPADGADSIPALDHAVPSRKVPVTIRTIGGDTISGMIFIRNSILRTKDELNLKTGDFLPVIDVQAQAGFSPDEVYFINKRHIIFLNVIDDQLGE